MSLYNIAQPVGAMLSGALQGAISTNLHGSLGRTGWQWAFIVNVSGCVSQELNVVGRLHHLCRACGVFWPPGIREWQEPYL